MLGQRKTAPNVLVVGASVPGLSLAHGLRKRGVPVTVYEKREHIAVEERKTLLRVDKWALAGLASCLSADLYDRCLELRNALDDALLTHYDTHLCEVHSVEAAKMSSAPAHTVMDHERLRTILLAGMPDIVRFGHTVTGYRELRDRVGIRFADGGEAHGDLLVLADGRHSAARDAHLGKLELLDTGLVAIHGHAPIERELFTQLPRGFLLHDRPILGPRRTAMTVCAYLPQALSRSAQLGAAGLAGLRGYVKWTSVLPARSELAGYGQAMVHEIVMEQVASWHPAVVQLVTQSVERGLFTAPIQASVPLQPRRSGLATTLGSAARVVPSVGVLTDGLALHDAGRLAVGIHQDERAGIAGHDQRMLDEGNSVVGQALEQIERTFNF